MPNLPQEGPQNYKEVIWAFCSWLIYLVEWSPEFLHYFQLPLRWSYVNSVPACKLLAISTSHAMAAALQCITNHIPLALIRTCARYRQSIISLSLGTVPLLLWVSFCRLPRIASWFWYSMIPSVCGWLWLVFFSFGMVMSIWCVVSLFLVVLVACRQSRMDQFLADTLLQQRRLRVESRVPYDMASINKNHTAATHKKKRDHWTRHVKRPITKFNQAQREELGNFTQRFPGCVPPEWLASPLILPPMPPNPTDIIEICSSGEASPLSICPAGLRAGGPSNTDADKQSQGIALPSSNLLMPTPRMTAQSADKCLTSPFELVSESDDDTERPNPWPDLQKRQKAHTPRQEGQVTRSASTVSLLAGAKRTQRRLLAVPLPLSKTPGTQH